MVLEQLFANPAGYWAALALIPFLILYLIRPSPKERVIPSLMFLLRDRDKARSNAFFRTLLRELVFLLQLLIIISLVAAAAQPFLSVPARELLTDTIIVLDDSASMHALGSSSARWQQAAGIARENLGDDNTIILAGRIPQVVLEGADADQAREFLQTWRPSHQPTYLAPAILAAQDHLGPDSRILVISDFADTDPDTDYADAVQTLRARGATVDLEQVGESGRAVQNIGIVDVEVSESRTTVLVQNFYENARTVNVCAGDTCEDLPLGPGSTDTFSFPTQPGVTEVALQVDDDLPVDDVAMISASPTTNIRVLVVTNEEFEGSSLFYALQAIQRTTPLTIDIQVNTPPQLVSVDHDLIVFDRVDADLLVSRTVRETIQRVQAGAGAVIMYQDDLFRLGYGELLPLAYVDQGEATAVLNTESSRRFTGMDFGSTPTYHLVEPQKNMQVLARAEDDSPLLATYAVGAGQTLYYGLPSQAASFTGDPLYPVFWREMVNQLTGRQHIDDLNQRTGILINAQSVRTPDGSREEGRVLLEQQGLYETPAGAVAATLQDAHESNIALPSLEQRGSVRSYAGADTQAQRDITAWVLLAALLFAFLELLYIKWRGDV